jgi:small conductance mechanosensitive channel
MKLNAHGFIRELICHLRCHRRLLVFASVDAQSLNSFLIAAADAGSKTNAPFKIPLTREEIFTLTKDYGPKAVAAVIIFIVGLLIARRVGKILAATLAKREMEPPVRMLFVRIAKLCVMLLAILVAVQQLGVELWPLIAGLGVAGVGVGLAMQGVLSNLVAGLTIIFIKPFRVGEYIQINNVEGQVDVIELFSTTLVHPDLSRVVIPNRKIVGEILHNYGKIRQASLSVAVAYDTDLNRALEIIGDILARNPRVLKNPAPGVGTATLADFSIVLAIKPWVALADFGPAQAEINKSVIEAFREARIEIPLPQREIRLLPGADLKSVA